MYIKIGTVVFANDSQTERRQDLYLFVASTSVQQPPLLNTSPAQWCQSWQQPGRTPHVRHSKLWWHPVWGTRLCCQHSTDAKSRVAAWCSQVDILVWGGGRGGRGGSSCHFIFNPPRHSAIRIRCSAGVHNVHNLLTVSRAQTASGERERCAIVENVIWLTEVLTDNNNNEKKKQNCTRVPSSSEGNRAVHFKKTLKSGTAFVSSGGEPKYAAGLQKVCVII